MDIADDPGIEFYLKQADGAVNVIWTSLTSENARSFQIVDAACCGDSYVLGYLYRRAQGDSPRDAALFASAVATVNIEAHGPFRATEAEVLSRLREMGL